MKSSASQIARVKLWISTRDSEKVRSTMVMGSAANATQRQELVMPASDAASGQLAVRVEVDPSDVVFIKGLVEASDGLASVFCDRGGSLVLAAPLDRRAELALFLRDLEADVGARVIDRAVFEASS